MLTDLQLELIVPPLQTLVVQLQVLHRVHQVHAVTACRGRVEEQEVRVGGEGDKRRGWGGRVEEQEERGTRREGTRDKRGRKWREGDRRGTRRGRGGRKRGGGSRTRRENVYKICTAVHTDSENVSIHTMFVYACMYIA